LASELTVQLRPITTSSGMTARLPNLVRTAASDKSKILIHPYYPFQNSV
jgi:hypothetical protein